MNNKFNAFNNFSRLMSKSSDNGTEQVCMEVCGSLCQCGPDPCVCPKDGFNESKVGFIRAVFQVCQVFVLKRLQNRLLKKLQYFYWFLFYR